MDQDKVARIYSELRKESMVSALTVSVTLRLKYIAVCVSVRYHL